MRRRRRRIVDGAAGGKRKKCLPQLLLETAAAAAATVDYRIAFIIAAWRSPSHITTATQYYCQRERAR